MEEPTNETTRLIPALPDGDFVREPQQIDRFTIQLLPDGVITFKGSRARIEEFLRLCKEEGLELRVDHVTLCG